MCMDDGYEGQHPTASDVIMRRRGTATGSLTENSPNPIQVKLMILSLLALHFCFNGASVSEQEAHAWLHRN